MIGQIELLGRLNTLVENNTFPRFSILVGQDGSGKSLLANEIAHRLANHISPSIDVKIDSIREMIGQSYKVVDKMVYIIPDADGMSLAAKNALLKVTEEPPNNAYFIMTLQNVDNTLATIRSRATIFNMDIYTKDELRQIAVEFGGSSNGSLDIILSVCDTPLEVKKMLDCDSVEFIDYIDMVIDNVVEVSVSNAFKIAGRIQFKEDQEGYDLVLFWKLFTTNCLRRCSIGQPETIKYLEGSVITSKYLRGITMKSVNKQMLFDMWLMDIRKAWRAD